MNLKRHLQSSRSVWTFFDQIIIFWTLPYVLFNILALFWYLMKTNHFAFRETSHYANLNSFLLIKWPKTPPLWKPFIVFTYQSLGKNIKKDTWEGPKSIELVEKTAHRLGTFFGLPNRFHLIQCGVYHFCNSC